MDSGTSSLSTAKHRRKASSKSGILHTLVSSKAQPACLEPSTNAARNMLILPPDHPHASRGGAVLGERQSNVQSPPSSPPKSKRPDASPRKLYVNDDAVRVPVKTHDGNASPKKTKSSTNLAAVFARMNRSNKNLAQTKDKENTTPPQSSSSSSSTEPPIWAQFSTVPDIDCKGLLADSTNNNIHDEIARYTPREYSPGKQRNFNGSQDYPSTTPTLAKNRPLSINGLSSGSFIGTLGRSGQRSRTSTESRRSEDGRTARNTSNGARTSQEPPSHAIFEGSNERKASGSSAGHDPFSANLNVAKRGKVMAAVAALQGKMKDQKPTAMKEAPDSEAVAKQFEAVLAAREIPEHMRQKMRALTLRVKMDFIRQDQDNLPSASTPVDKPTALVLCKDADVSNTTEENGKNTKRSRSRSRTFTFSKADKREDCSPAKKHRSQSKRRPLSVDLSKASGGSTFSTPTTPTNGSFGRQAAPPALPADYITYLRKIPDPTKVEVGRMHKLRLLLRNETVAWVDNFIAQGGMSEISRLLHRIMELEWREEHEDQLLHETLLCLKGLCTTERAMTELDKIADNLFPALLGMLFGEEKKGPAEYNTRTIITTVLFNFLAASTSASGIVLEQRARRILSFLAEPQKPELDRPVDFVLHMRVARPYKLWCSEMSNVTREVFWIFLHRLNIVPLPRPATSSGQNVDCDPSERARILAATYSHRHFPGTRPPVPAAPYIGGVEWDATTYITSHLDLMNGLIASLPRSSDRNELRAELRASGFEKVMGSTLRTCKEKFYAGVHDGLKSWVAAAVEDEWATLSVREGPSEEELAERALKASPKKSPNKKKSEPAPQLEALLPPKLELDLRLGEEDDPKITHDGNEHGDRKSGWLE